MFDRSRRRRPQVAATGFACTDDDVGSWSAGRTSSRSTTGLGPVSSGSPLTSGVGAHSLSVAFALLPRSARSRGRVARRQLRRSRVVAVLSRRQGVGRLDEARQLDRRVDGCLCGRARSGARLSSSPGHRWDGGRTRRQVDAGRPCRRRRVPRGHEVECRQPTCRIRGRPAGRHGPRFEAAAEAVARPTRHRDGDLQRVGRPARRPRDQRRSVLARRGAPTPPVTAVDSGERGGIGRGPGPSGVDDRPPERRRSPGWPPRRRRPRPAASGTAWPTIVVASRRSTSRRASAPRSWRSAATRRRSNVWSRAPCGADVARRTASDRHVVVAGEDRRRPTATVWPSSRFITRTPVASRPCEEISRTGMRISDAARRRSTKISSSRPTMNAATTWPLLAGELDAAARPGRRGPGG